MSARLCRNWERGFGCDKTRCHFTHDPAKDFLNHCHRFQRGQDCPHSPCFRLHVFPTAASATSSASAPPAPPPAQPPQDVVLDTVRQVLANVPVAGRRATARQLLLIFHPDRTGPNELLIKLFEGTVRFLTAEISDTRHRY